MRDGEMGRKHKNKIKNVRGTKDRNCMCGTWIKHWRNYSCTKETGCVVRVADHAGKMVGAHVTAHVPGHVGRQQWIVPMCDRHNSRFNVDHMPIEGNTKLVPANMQQTGCDKRTPRSKRLERAPLFSRASELGPVVEIALVHPERPIAPVVKQPVAARIIAGDLARLWWGWILLAAVLVAVLWWKYRRS